MGSSILNLHTLHSCWGMHWLLPRLLARLADRLLAARLFRHEQLYRQVVTNVCRRACYEHVPGAVLQRIRELDPCGMGVWYLYNGGRCVDLHHACRAAIARIGVSGHWTSELLLRQLAVPDALTLESFVQRPNLMVAFACALGSVGLWASAAAVLRSRGADSETVVANLLDAGCAFRLLGSLLSPRQKSPRVAVLICTHSCNAAAAALRRKGQHMPLADEAELGVDCARSCLVAAEEAATFAAHCFGTRSIIELDPFDNNPQVSSAKTPYRRISNSCSSAVSQAKSKDQVRSGAGDRSEGRRYGGAEAEELVAALRTYAALCARVAAHRELIRELGTSAVSRLQPAGRELFLRVSARLSALSGLRLNVDDADCLALAGSCLTTFRFLVEQLAGYCLLRRVVAAACGQSDAEHGKRRSVGQADRLAKAVTELCTGQWKLNGTADNKRLLSGVILQALQCLAADSASSALAAAYLLLLPSLPLQLDRVLWKIISRRGLGRAERWFAFQLWLDCMVRQPGRFHFAG